MSAPTPTRPAPGTAENAASTVPAVRVRRKYGELVGWALLALAAAGFLANMLTNPRWRWDVVGQFLFDPLVLRGVGSTIFLTLVSGLCGLLLGLVVALMKLSSSRVLQTVATAYIGFIRAIPALVLILLLYFISALFPTLEFGIPFLPPLVEVPTNSLITKFGAAWLGLTMLMAAHCGEIIRGGISAVPPGQLEASKALSLGRFTAYRKVILPQAIRVSIPSFANELITLFKNTSLVSVIGYAELLTVVQGIYGRTYQTIPLLTVACIWYLTLTVLSMVGQSRLEKKYGRGFQRR
ncbi:amino acid ABC transporter permease [Arthrobacter ginkgonis]|uniref:Amino acid ABC transporter permease n=1 Tax=Arthrobacter ginkgonis TaxID=1630594 RepID=A0ABP7C5X3_9MICC